MPTETTTTFSTWTRDAWDRMFADMEIAQTSILLEQYIFTIDDVGWKFIDLCRQKASLGVKVWLLIDMVGSAAFYRSTLPEELRRSGVDIKFFNPIRLWRLLNFTSNFFRDHRKILVIDGKIGHIGGAGIQSDMINWRDTNIRVTGPLVAEMERSFEVVWNTVGRGAFVRTDFVRREIKDFALLTNSPRPNQRHIYQTLLGKLRTAQKQIYLTTPYFIPDVPFFRAMQAAAKRGVDVRLIVPSIADHLFIDHARETYFSLLLKGGIKIYRYQPVMMHAKTMVIDDWATIGSFNLDSLSFLFNHEANVASTDTEFVQAVRNHFQTDMKNSKEVLYHEWIRRSLIKKILEVLTWPFHQIM